MRILILHRNKFDRLGYDRAIDHSVHHVVYAGTADYLDNIPPGIRCETFVLEPERPIVQQLRPWLRNQPLFDRILARHELHIIPAAELRAEFGLPGMRPDLALKFRDKVVMKATVANQGIRVPRYFPANLLPREAPWPGKVIVKPRDANASQGVHLCDDYSAAYQLVAARQRDDATFAGRYEVEEYLDGPIWCIDGFLFRGEPVAIQASRYINTPLGFEHGIPHGSVQYPNPKLESWTVRCLRALGAQTLTFHLESIMTAEGPAFLEVAARCGGGYIVGMFHRRTGVHLHTVDMATDINGDLAIHLFEEPSPTTFYGDFLYPGHNYGGAPITVPVPPEVLGDSRLITYKIFPPNTPTPTNANYRPENLAFSGIVSGPDPASVEEWIQSLLATVTVYPRVAANS
ncbi:MAG: ATP-grasp domain-containing protein [Pseudonocardiaceae bacterium]